jgi:hypothetical protein
MKWKDSKDSNEMNDPVEQNKEEYFDEEQYSPWTRNKDTAQFGRLRKIPTMFILIGLAVVTSLAALLMLLLSTQGDPANDKQLVLLQEKIKQLEERLDRYEGVDEKVTRIWEQARAFEKFKDRFDRSETSIMLRMDQMTTSLESVQKQVGQIRKAPPVVSAPVRAAPVKAESTAARNRFHTVEAGDTLYSISKKYGIEVDDLLKMNQLEKESILNLGQKLIVQ